MVSLFDDVRGSTLTIQYLHASIPFTTSSDALFSSLFIKHSNTVPLKVFDDILALFQHTEFHSRKVSLKKSEDILDHIAGQRRIISMSRGLKQDKGQRSAATDLSCYPQTRMRLVAQLLADYIAPQRIPLHHTYGNMYLEQRPNHCEMTKMLLAMTLVHRTWTEASQRHLRRRIDNVNEKKLWAVIENPLIGTWVRELGFRRQDFKHEINGEESSRLFLGVLERCPNITHLCIDTDRLVYSEFGRPEPNMGKLNIILYDVLHRIVDLKRLEHLWLRLNSETEAGYQNFGRLCSLIPSLLSLKSLSLENWMSQDPMDIDPEVPEGEHGNTLNLTHLTTLPASLETLSLVDVDFFTSGLLAWIMNPQGKNKVTRLKLKYNNIFSGDYGSGPRNLERLRSLFENRMAHVRKLQIVGCLEYDKIELLLQFFPSLQTLSLYSSSREGNSSNEIVLPQSLREFHCHFSYLGRLGILEDTSMCHILKTCPQVRRVIVTYARDHFRFEAPFTNCLEYSSRNNVEFKVLRSENPPHILDL